MRPSEHRNAVTRRDVLHAGGAAAAGLTLPRLLRAEAAAKAAGRPAGRAKSVIVFATNGGTGQMDSFDPKPDAPAEVRGEFKPIDTNVPGVRINEHLPRLAGMMDRCAVVRSLHHTDTVHPGALYWTFCGSKVPRVVTPDAATGSREDRPHFASVLAKLQPGPRDLPGFVAMPAAMGPNGPDWPGQHAGFLGPAFDPFRVNFDVDDPRISPGAAADDPRVPVRRVAARRSLLARVSDRSAELDRTPAAKALAPHLERAFDVIASPSARKAFDLDREPPAVRDRYGRHWFGQSLLLARRLVEAGVRVVQVNWPRSNISTKPTLGYDTHQNCFPIIKNELYPPTDVAFTALLEDLSQRGMLDETLVLFFNEFGRSPRVNGVGGRDHWPQCYSTLLAGGGVRGGTVYGASDKIGAYPAADPVTPEDLLATIYHLLGVDPNTVLEDELGRPHHLIDGRPIAAIV